MNILNEKPDLMYATPLGYEYASMSDGTDITVSGAIEIVCKKLMTDVMLESDWVDPDGVHYWKWIVGRDAGCEETQPWIVEYFIVAKSNEEKIAQMAAEQQFRYDEMCRRLGDLIYRDELPENTQIVLKEV